MVSVFVVTADVANLTAVVNVVYAVADVDSVAPAVLNVAVRVFEGVVDVEYTTLVVLASAACISLVAVVEVLVAEVIVSTVV